MSTPSRHFYRHRYTGANDCYAVGLMGAGIGVEKHLLAMPSWVSSIPGELGALGARHPAAELRLQTGPALRADL